MFNIMKSLFYELFRTRGIKLTIFGITLINSISFISQFISTEDMTVSFCIADFMMMIVLYTMYAMIFVVVIAVMGDGTDKTINYEILAGHSRKEIFAARALVSFIAGLIIYLIGVITPVLAIIIIFGWDGNMALSSLIIRLLVSALSMLKFISLIIFIAFIVKSHLKAGALSFLVLMADTLVTECIGTRTEGILCYSDLYSVWHMNCYSSYTVSLDMELTYDYSLAASSCISVAVFSIILTALYLSLGLHFFSKDDLN